MHLVVHLLTRFSRVAMKKKTRVQQGLADGKRGTDSMELPGPGSCASLPCSWRINLSPFTKDFRAWKALIAYWNFSAALLYRAVTSLWLVSKVDIHYRIQETYYIPSVGSVIFIISCWQRQDCHPSCSSITGVPSKGCLNDQAYIAWFTSTRGVYPLRTPWAFTSFFRGQWSPA